MRSTGRSRRYFASIAWRDGVAKILPPVHGTLVQIAQLLLLLWCTFWQQVRQDKTSQTSKDSADLKHHNLFFSTYWTYNDRIKGKPWKQGTNTAFYLWVRWQKREKITVLYLIPSKSYHHWQTILSSISGIKMLVPRMELDDWMNVKQLRVCGLKKKR